MKKVLFFALAAFVSATVGAQVVTSTSFRKAENATIWYVKAGMSMNNMSADGESADAKIGYNVGIAFDRTIGGSGMFWNSGLQLATKGFKAGEDDYETKFTAHKLEIPVTLGYKFGVSDDVKVDVRAGGFVNYDLFGKLKMEEDGEEYDIKIGDIDGYDRFSAGIQFGVGAWYQKLNINITYQLGLVDQNEMKERNWMISLGYAF